MKKEIDPLTQQWTDKKYNLFVDINNGKTQKLELHMIPTQINRTDVMKVLRVVVETLTYIDDAEDRALGFSNNYVMFHGDFINFTKAANILIENLN